MRVRLRDFDAARFSLREDPVLVLEEFWSQEEMAGFRAAMQAAQWTARDEMPDVLLPFVAEFVDSFEGVIGRVMNFNYFNYASGDCLSLHTDERSERLDDPRRESITRRVALATYVHDSWDVNWGGELIPYDKKASGGQDEAYDITNCISPEPGSLVLFTVPRHHRVCRVDPLAGDNKRLSIAGWFMTDHGE